MIEIANTGQKHEGRWKAGQSGNPAGKPRGARNRATLAAQALLDGESEALTRRAIELALAGDLTALRLCLDRILPPTKARRIEIDLPEVKQPKDAPIALAAILKATAAGELDTDQAAALADVIERHRRAVELTDIAARLDQLEEAVRRR